MCRSVENIYMKAVNGSGVFTTACTDGQAKYEAYLCQQRGQATEFRAKQYPAVAKEGAKFAARAQAIARNHICVYEDNLYAEYPRLAGSMRPSFGYYTPFVSSPRQGYGGGGVTTEIDQNVLIATVSALAAGAAWFVAHSGGAGMS